MFSGNVPYVASRAKARRQALMDKARLRQLINQSPDQLTNTVAESGYQNEINRYLTGASRQRISKGNLKKIQIPLPPVEVQQQILDELDGYQKLIDENEKIIEIYNQKIKDKIDKIWGE